ncbi:MAG TPA: phosphatidylserine decarboxylase, partial [bacterium]|nr:phosphatidylserine decarboxylase [bacterium]
MPGPLYFYRRGSDQKEEEIILGGGLMRWAYQSRAGKALTGFLFNRRWPSRLAGWYADSRWSRRQIAPVIRNLGIDTGELDTPVESYATFNAFFTRRLK